MSDWLIALIVAAVLYALSRGRDNDGRKWEWPEEGPETEEGETR